MDRILVLFCLVGSISARYVAYDGFSSYPGDSLPPGAVSKRDADDNSVTPVTTQEIYKQTTDLLTLASQGISGEDLGEGADEIEDAAQAYLDSKGLTASDEDVQAFIEDIAATLNVTDSSLAILFGDELTEQASILDVSLNLLQAMVARAQEREAAGLETTTAIACIARVAQVVEKSAFVTGEIIKYVGPQAENEDAETRSARQVRTTKRGGSFNAGGYYGGRGNWGVSAGFTYTWGRK